MIALLARLALAVVVGVIVYLLCGLFGPLIADLKASFAVTIGNWISTNAGILGLLAALLFFFAGYAGGSFSLPTWPRRPPP